MTEASKSVKHFPTLQTERLMLRQLTTEDLEFVYQHFRDPQVTQYLMDEPPVADHAQARAIIDFFAEPEGKSHNRWGLVRKADQRLIGTIGYHHWEKSYFRAEVGYDMSPDCWGHGYMTEALREVIRHGFEGMGLNRIDALIYVGNDASIRLAQRMGFRQEGLLRDYFCLNGAFYDHYLFALLRREWYEAATL